ncbi:hypothetical protein D9757_009858 [Collybiopsis confluens]|uniref:Uncharacterized protein n=1 Tax=Collybiopsis confluens TaxID=2823264 RepID=A0A8H5H791_9AGAR|nr:hypothetical protein D9757_009858 [Collybiopsis confluens]
MALYGVGCLSAQIDGRFDWFRLSPSNFQRYTMWNRILFSCLSFYVGSVLSDSKPTSPFAVTVSPTITGQSPALAYWSYNGPSTASSHTLTLIVSPEGRTKTTYLTNISTNPLESEFIKQSLSSAGELQSLSQNVLPLTVEHGRVDRLGSATTYLTVVTSATITSEPSSLPTPSAAMGPSQPSPTTISPASPTPSTSPAPSTTVSTTQPTSNSPSSMSSSQSRSSTFTPTNSSSAIAPSASSISTSSNPKSSRSSSPGTIAAIVLGTIIGLFVLFLFIYWLWRRRWQRVRRENEARATAFFPDLMLARPQAMPIYDEWEKDFYDASSTLAPSDSVSRFQSPRPAPGHKKVRPLVPSTVLTSLS